MGVMELAADFVGVGGQGDLVVCGLGTSPFLPLDKGRCYSAPIWAPFSATERRMSSMSATNRTPTAAENEKTSK